MSLESEARDVDFLRTTEGWKILLRELQTEIDKTLKDLRKSCKEDNQKRVIGFSRYMDGLEFAMKLPDRIINRGELQQPT